MTLSTEPLAKSLTSTLQTLPKAMEQETQAFAAELQRQLMNTLHVQQDSAVQEQSDASLEAFKRELTSMGALNFLQSHNSDKIEALLEKKRAELMEGLGLSENAQPPLSADERKTALETLSSLMESYTKELMEKMKADDKLEQNNAMLSTILKQF